jgi:hypothetical protein
MLRAQEEEEAGGGKEGGKERGAAVTGTVVAVTPTEVQVKLDSGRYGRLHATSLPLTPVPAAAAPPRGRKAAAAAAAAASAAPSPLAAYAAGAAVSVRICGHARGDPAPDGKSYFELLLASGDAADGATEGVKVEDLVAGASVTGCVVFASARAMRCDAMHVACLHISAFSDVSRDHPASFFRARAAAWWRA